MSYFYNKQWTFITPEDFQKLEKIFTLKNEKKEQQKRLWFWGWHKMPTLIKHFKEVKINWKKVYQIPHWLRWIWGDKFTDNYWEVRHISFPDLINPYKWNELDLKQDKLVWELLEHKVWLGHCSTGVWKAQPLSAKLLTDKWWITMWEVKVWDKIFWADWKLTNVIWVFPQWEKDIYEIIFNDWTKTECCNEHLWTVQDYNDRKKSNSYRNVTRTITLGEIKDNIIKYKWKKSERLNYSVQMNESINFSKKDLKVKPYILGVLLWDWNLVTKNINFSNSELDIISKFKSLLDEWDYLSSNKDKRNNSINHKICNLNSKKSLTKISAELEKYNLIWTKSDTKFIPKEYLISSEEDRLELLRWLLDTDWYVITGRYKNTQIEYTTTSKKLIEWVEFLVRSLWGNITYSKRPSAYKKKWIKIECKPHYRAYIYIDKNIISSKKHLAKYTPSNKIKRKYIKEVNFIRREKAQCIMVDNKDKLYITDDFIVTHNTIITAKLIKSIGVRTLIVVPNLTLMKQMQKDLKEILWVKYKTLSWEKTKQKWASEDIIIANIDTLVKQDREFFEGFDLAICDEVDTYLGSEKRQDIMGFMLSSKYIYWLTWTIKINYTPDKIFDIYFWPKSELLLKNFIPTIHKIYTWFSYVLEDFSKMHELKESLYYNEDRNNLIIDTIIDTLWDRKWIVFCEYIEHSKILKEKLEDNWIKVFLLIWEIKKDDRKRIIKELKEYKWKCILIWSVKIIWRWFNLPELSVWYLTTAEKFVSNIEQYVGRVIRQHKGKQEAHWYDFVDENCRLLFNQSKNRTTTYRKEYKWCKILVENIF